MMKNFLLVLALVLGCSHAFVSKSAKVAVRVESTELGPFANGPMNGGVEGSNLTPNRYQTVDIDNAWGGRYHRYGSGPSYMTRYGYDNDSYGYGGYGGYGGTGRYTARNYYNNGYQSRYGGYNGYGGMRNSNYYGSYNNGYNNGYGYNYGYMPDYQTSYSRAYNGRRTGSLYDGRPASYGGNYYGNQGYYNNNNYYNRRNSYYNNGYNNGYNSYYNGGYNGRAMRSYGGSGLVRQGGYGGYRSGYNTYPEDRYEGGYMNRFAGPRYSARAY